MVLTTILPVPKVIAPEVWPRYLTLLREGWSREAAARKVGVSRQTARDFLKGNSATARRWRETTAGPCPLCGCMDMHDDE